MKITYIALAAVALSAAASAQDVTYNFDPATDFSKFHTYRWVEIPGGAPIDGLIARQLDTAIQAELARKGLTKTDSESPDLFVGYQVAINQEKSISAYGMGPRYLGGGLVNAQTSTIQIGTLDLDMYDAKKQLVWRGAATKTIDAGAKPEKRQKNIENGAAKLLKNYPPKTK